MNILTLAAYEQTRRALRGECEPNSRLSKVRTNIRNKQSADKAKMREVSSLSASSVMRAEQTESSAAITSRYGYSLRAATTELLCYNY